MTLEKEFDFMSAKNVDRKNRFRSITVGFRVSPEEQEELNRAVALSGLPKQEYCYRKCMGREVVIQPNPRVYKALKTQMAAIHEELERIAAGIFSSRFATQRLCLDTGAQTPYFGVLWLFGGSFPPRRPSGSFWVENRRALFLSENMT